MIIQNYQELKKNVLEKVDKYVEKWTTIDGFRGWYLSNNNNLMIENKTISRYGGQLSSYKIKLIEDNKKALNVGSI